jgi:hypothetical protein
VAPAAEKEGQGEWTAGKPGILTGDGPYSKAAASGRPLFLAAAQKVSIDDLTNSIKLHNIVL